MSLLYIDGPLTTHVYGVRKKLEVGMKKDWPDNNKGLVVYERRRKEDEKGQGGKYYE